MAELLTLLLLLIAVLVVEGGFRLRSWWRRRSIELAGDWSGEYGIRRW